MSEMQETKTNEDNMQGKRKGDNPLGKLPVGKLLYQFTIPSIIAMLVSSLYNIVDQFFIGHRVGELGNAATNIAFPLSMSCMAIALMCGIGGSSAFNLAMGAGKKKEAASYVGNAIALMLGVGILLTIVVKLTLSKLLIGFGSTTDILPYAKVYTSITSLGFPFLILATGGGHLVRADGSPKITMLCNIVGAVVNTILDYIFVFVFDFGMAGAAYATIIGQFVSATIVIIYFCNYKTVKLTFAALKFNPAAVQRVASLGLAPCFNQLAMMVVQIVLNNSLKHYGALSIYGENIPIACVGIISKVNMVFFSFIIGISQGLQPIVSFNYGAKKYDRVKRGYRLAVTVGLIISTAAFIIFQTFPRQIIGIFGDGSDLYFDFGVKYLRIYLFITFLNFMQPISSNFFTAIGKPVKGVFLSLTRQIIFLLPLILLMPLFFGMDGIVFSGPIADGMAAVVSIIMVAFEMKIISGLQKQEK